MAHKITRIDPGLGDKTYPSFTAFTDWCNWAATQMAEQRQSRVALEIHFCPLCHHEMENIGPDPNNPSRTPQVYSCVRCGHLVDSRDTIVVQGYFPINPPKRVSTKFRLSPELRKYGDSLR